MTDWITILGVAVAAIAAVLSLKEFIFVMLEKKSHWRGVATKFPGVPKERIVCFCPVRKVSSFESRELELSPDDKLSMSIAPSTLRGWQAA